MACDVSPVAMFENAFMFLVQVQDPESTCEWVMWGEKFRSLQEFVHFFQVPSTSRFDLFWETVLLFNTLSFYELFLMPRDFAPLFLHWFAFFRRPLLTKAMLA